jgi:hypothetical protein
MFFTLQAQIIHSVTYEQLQDHSVCECCYYTDRRSVSSVSTSPRYFVIVLSLYYCIFISLIPVQEKKHKVLVSDDVERECLKTSNKGSGTHTGGKGFSHTGICTQGIFGGGKKN